MIILIELRRIDGGIDKLDTILKLDHRNGGVISDYALDKDKAGYKKIDNLTPVNNNKVFKLDHRCGGDISNYATVRYADYYEDTYENLVTKSCGGTAQLLKEVDTRQRE